MSAEPDTRQPSPATALAVTAGLIVLWGIIRLELTATTSVFPLTYAIPLLVHVCEAVRLPASEPTARALMAQTRRAMLEHLDEPDLAPAGAYIPE